MTVISTEHIAIAELAVYIPVGIISLFVVFRHGFHRQLGWIYLFVLSAIRIAGGVFEIKAHNNPSDSNSVEWALILQSVGLSPLLLASLGLIKRICDEISNHVPGTSTNVVQGMATMGGIGGKLAGIYGKRATANSRRSRCVQLLHIPALIALILSISGGTDQFSSDVSDHSTGKTDSRVGIILFLAVYVCLFILTMITFGEYRIMRKDQQRIFICVIIALPLIAVRLLYSLIGDFNKNTNNQFSIATGSPTIQLAMATVEELLVVIMYAILGVITPRAQATQKYEEPVYLQQAQQDPEYAPPQINYASHAARNAYQANAYQSNAYQGNGYPANTYQGRGI